MSIMHIIIGWLFVMAGYLLWAKFREDHATQKKYWDFGDYNFLVRSLALLLLTWIGFSIFSPEPHFDSPEKQIAYAEKYHQPWLVTSALAKKIEHDPKNLDLHYRLVSSHFETDESEVSPKDIYLYRDEGIQIFNYYDNLSQSTAHEELADIGNLFLALYYIETPQRDVEMASFHLRQVKNQRLKYFNYVFGQTVLYSAGPLAAEPYFYGEIQNHGFREGAYRQLAWIAEWSGEKTALEKLVYNKAAEDFIPNTLRYKVYFLNGDLLSFYKLHFVTLFSGLPFWGILGDLLILFTWIFFLRQLSFLSRIKWKHFALAIGIGVVLAMVSWLLYEFYHDVLHFNITGGIGNDMLYCFLGIGVIEELVKLIPFLILLRFTNIIKKPVDYLLIASAAGLGFAFFENLLYISLYGLDVIHARALTASVSHMASSALVAYGFVLVKFRYPDKKWIIPLFFLAAALAHGFYDFWLMNDKVHSLSIVTLFFYLSEILVYVSFLNNALNQSAANVQPAGQYALNTQRLASFIAGALILVFIIEYAGTCLVYGTSTGNHTLMSSFLSGGYLVFFLSVRLSNIDIEPGKWRPIEFFTGLLPSELLGSSSRKRNYDSAVGMRLNFQRDVSTGTFAFRLPLSGQVTRRLTIQGFNGWFEFQLDNPIAIGAISHEKLYFRAKETSEIVDINQSVTVGLFARVPDLNDPKKSRLMFLDWATT